MNLLSCLKCYPLHFLFHFPVIEFFFHQSEVESPSISTMQSAFDKLLNTFAPHVFEKIFLSLDYKSFKNCHEVCTTWNKILSATIMKKKANNLLRKNGDKLITATCRKNENDVKRILTMEMVDVNLVVVESHNTILNLALRMGNQPIIKLLLDAGADPNGVDEFGWTPLHTAAGGKQTEMMELLLDHGANPNKASNQGYKPLAVAAKFGTKEKVQLLIKRGTEIGKKERAILKLLRITFTWK